MKIEHESCDTNLYIIIKPTKIISIENLQTSCLIALALLAIVVVAEPTNEDEASYAFMGGVGDVDRASVVLENTKQPRAKRASYGKDFDIQVIKKPGRVRQIHLYPYGSQQQKKQQEELSSQQALLSQDMYGSKGDEQDSADSTNVEKLTGSTKDYGSEASTSKDNLGSDSHSHYIKDQKEKIKIKHHHHHHHHNHVKTVVKKQPYPVEKIVHVPKPYPVSWMFGCYFDRCMVGLPWRSPMYFRKHTNSLLFQVEKIVEKVVHVPVHKVIEVPRPYPVEKIVEKLVQVPKPYPVKEVIEKKVPYQVNRMLISTKWSFC